MKQSKVSNSILLLELLKSPGASDEEIGKKLGLSRVQICRRRNSPEFKQLLSTYSECSFNIFRKHQFIAAAKVCDLLEHSDARIVLKAAELIFNIAPAEERVKDKSKMHATMMTLIDRVKAHANR